MSLRRSALAAVLAASSAALSTAPADAALPMKFWLEYAGTGTVAFACHNVAATLSGTSLQTGTGTRVSCSLNGFTSVQVASTGSTATSAGLANATVGSTVTVCISAATVYGFPHMQGYSIDTCGEIVLAPAGVVYL